MNLFALNATLTKDPELQYGQSGKAWLSFSVAYNHDKETVSFLDCKAWDRTAEMIAQCFRKGDGINLEGEIRQERWEDSNGGGQRSKIVLNARRVSFPHGKKGSAGAPSGNAGSARQAQAAARPAPTRPGSAPPPRPGAAWATPTDDDLALEDIPF